MALAIDYKRYPLTEKLTAAQFSEIYTYLSRVEPSDTARLCENIVSETPFVGSFWDENGASKWTIVALDAFLRGRITEDQFVTIALLSAAVQQFVETAMAYSSFTHRTRGGEVTTEWNFTKVSGVPKCDRKIEVIDIGDPRYEECLGNFFRFMNPAERALLRAKVSLYPFAADRCIVLVPASDTSLQYLDPMLFRIVLATNAALYPFKGEEKFYMEGERQFVLPAFPVLRCAFSLGKVPIEVKPVIGEVTQADVVADRFCFSHVVGIDVMGAPLPQIADGHATGKGGFSFHDMYHCYTYWKSPSIKSMLLVNRILQLLVREEPRTPILDRLIGFYADSEFVRFSDFKGNVGYALNESKLFIDEGKIYRQKIVWDVAWNHSFWQWVCPDISFGLTSEELEYIRGHQRDAWPSYIEMEELLQKPKEYANIINALKPFDTHFRPHFSLALDIAIIKIYSLPEQIRKDLLSFLITLGTTKVRSSEWLRAEIMFDIFRVIQRDDRERIAKFARLAALNSVTILLRLILSSSTLIGWDRILECLDQCEFFDPGIVRSICAETESNEQYCYILINPDAKKYYCISNLERDKIDALQVLLKDLWDIPLIGLTKFVLKSFNLVGKKTLS